jgi:excisionase family DNA binding protein
MTGTNDPTGTDPDVSLTTAEAAEMAGVSPRTIRRWIEKGALPAMTGAGGVFYVFARDVEAARLASLSRSSGTPHLTARFTVVGDNNTVPDASGSPGASQLTPDPASGPAGAILVAWRDTVLAPVVEELSATRRELGQVRQELGRAEAERDQVTRERDDLRAELVATQATRDMPQDRDPATLRGDQPTQTGERLIERVRRLLGR